MRTDGSGKELERVRMIAANMFEQGRPPKSIAGDLGVAGQTVRAWRRAWRAGGRAALAAKAHPGRPARLDDAQRARLAALLVGPPAACGFADRHLWTAALVADLIRREFGVDYHHDYVGTLLHALGFTHQAPARRAAERDEPRIAAWRAGAWPALLKKTRRPAG